MICGENRLRLVHLSNQPGLIGGRQSRMAARPQSDRRPARKHQIATPCTAAATRKNTDVPWPRRMPSAAAARSRCRCPSRTRPHRAGSTRSAARRDTTSTSPPGGNCAIRRIGPRVGQPPACALTKAGAPSMAAAAVNSSRLFIRCLRDRSAGQAASVFGCGSALGPQRLSKTGAKGSARTHTMARIPGDGHGLPHRERLPR